ncbi:DUF2059 domain-containing protein [Chitinilyticum litopenaei]|uniref:DUF2059 domain-containing protein n=1 Tax=Chitinilyticum litopenaei TaxID=1121276 RepID=UPI000425D722|nr:DUF2059 domain-containing protein [Chitinilyticum litopenaei]
MKKLTLSLLLAAAVLAVPVYAAEPDSRQKATELIEMLDMRRLMDAALEDSMQSGLASNPEMAPFVPVIREFLARHMSYDSLQPELVSLYADNFTASELDAVLDFYRSPIGKKVIERMPALMKAGSDIANKRVAAHMPELMAALREARKKNDAQAAPAEATPD